MISLRQHTGYEQIQVLKGANKGFKLFWTGTTAAAMAGDSKALVKKEGGNRRERRANEKSKVDNTHRRTWDKDDYEERAAAREKV